MKLITERDKIRGAAEAWRSQYFSGSEWASRPARSRDIHDALVALDTEAATENDVAEIIGNSSWTDIVCDECEKKSLAVVQVGDDPDYGSKTFWMCEECIDASKALIKQNPER